MARQTFYLAKDVRHPLYKTRMLQAGPLELDASAARLYRRLGVDLREEPPKRAKPLEPEDFETLYPEPVLRKPAAPKPAAAKAPAKKAARRKKS